MKTEGSCTTYLLFYDAKYAVIWIATNLCSHIWKPLTCCVTTNSIHREQHLWKDQKGSLHQYGDSVLRTADILACNKTLSRLSSWQSSYKNLKCSIFFLPILGIICPIFTNVLFILLTSVFVVYGTFFFWHIFITFMICWIVYDAVLWLMQTSVIIFLYHSWQAWNCLLCWNM